MSNVTRILHVHGGFNVRGGIQNWLLLLADRMDSEKFVMDFLVSAEPDEKVRSLVQINGGRILVCPPPRHVLAYAGCFFRSVRRLGKYDIVHTHSYTYAGLNILLAWICRVPIRIVHSHNVYDHLTGRTRAFRKVFNTVMQHIIGVFATGGLAVSEDAARVMFGKHWMKDSRWRIFPCGIDLRPFEQEVSRAELREKLAIPAGAFVVGHVGRFAPVRNHRFVLDVFLKFRKMCPGSYLLLIGDGPLRKEIEEHAQETGISEFVRFTGARDDVPALLKGAMDAFVFPTIEEGLGLAVIEAQLAGLPVLTSDAIPLDAEIPSSGIRRFPLSCSAAQWAKELRAVVDLGRNKEPDLITSVRGSSLDIDQNAMDLADYYDRQFAKEMLIGKGCR